MKRILSLLLASTLIFSLVACNNEKNTSSNIDTSIHNTTQSDIEGTDNTNIEINESDIADESLSESLESEDKITLSPPKSNPATSNKNNTSSKPSQTISKPTETSKPITSSSKPSSSELSNSSSPNKWVYKNGGLGCIIKTNGIETQKIYLSSGSNKSEAENKYKIISDTEYGTQTYEIVRGSFSSLDGWIFFSQYYLDKYYSKQTKEEEITRMDYSFYKIREDGTQLTEIGSIPTGKAYNCEIEDLLGIKDGFLYLILGDLSWGDGEDVICKYRLSRIRINQITQDSAKKAEYISDIKFDINPEVGKNYIEGDWIYIQSWQGLKFKMKIDGTKQQQIT